MLLDTLALLRKQERTYRRSAMGSCLRRKAPTEIKP